MNYRLVGVNVAVPADPYTGQEQCGTSIHTRLDNFQPLIQAALLFPESPDVLRPLFYRTVSAGASGVFTVGSSITDLGDFLRRYPALMPTFPVHPQRYPPGLPVLFYGARCLFEAFPALSDALGFGLRRYQCHDFALMRLSNATLATAALQMALPALTGLIVFPLYGLARRTAGPRAALWAVMLYPLVPSFALWSARWDQFYPLLTCAAWYCLWRGLQEAGSWKLEARSKRQEAGGKKQEAGGRKQEAGSKKQEAGSKKQEAGSKKQGGGGRRQEVRSRKLAQARSGTGGNTRNWMLDYVSRFTHHVLRFTHYVLRFAFHASRFTPHVSRRPPHAWFLLGGLILSAATFLSFGPLVMLMPMGLAALLWVLPHPQRRQWARLALDALLFLAGLILPWIAYRLAFGNGFPDIWRVSMAYHLGLGREYSVWLFYHLYDFLAFLGLPLTLLLIAGLMRAIRARKDDRAALPLGFGLGLLLLDLSGTARGEVARVWLFLTPFAVIGAAYGLTWLTRRRWHVAAIVALLAAQLLVFNAFLRVVTTGLTDPPAYTRGLAIPQAHPFDARFGKRIALTAYRVEPEHPHPGDDLHVTLAWHALAPMTHPYTVFIHLLGPDGSLVAQHDGMPQLGQAPTTCWRPGEDIPDTHTLTIPPGAAPGDYTLVTGLYFWETGERLPAESLAAMPDGRVRLTTLTVTP